MSGRFSRMLVPMVCLLFMSVPANAEFWDFLGGGSNPTNSIGEDQPREPGWFSLPPLKWSDRAAPQGPNFLQRWQQATRRTLTQTREAIVSPFSSSGNGRSQHSLWPRWRGFGEPDSAGVRGMATASPEIQRPSSVNDFLKMPRPE
jgi:hypothetical protein